jgi:ABC-type phosphate transport system substrate-binding protein
MASARPVLLAVALALLLVGPATTAGQPAPTRPPLAIVVHRSNPVESLTSSELRRIFMLDTQTWPHGRKITVVLRDKGQPERAEAIRLICGISEREYERQILFRTFQGSVNIGPRAIQSAAAMLRFVYNAPGAIGYVNADEVDATVKLVRVNGLLPDDARYPLRRRPRPDVAED